MADLISLSAVTSTVLTEGVKFFFNLAGDALKRWRKRRDAPAAGGSSAGAPEQVSDSPPGSTHLPEIFEGQPAAPVPHFDALGRLEADINDLRKALSSYIAGVDPITPGDRELLEATDGLRRLMEAVYQQRFTLKGERRVSSGPVVEGRVDVDEVASHVAGVKARLITAGRISGEARAKTVAEGELYGVEADEIR